MCGAVVKRPLGDTSNLTGHLKRHHPAEHQQLLRRETERKDEEVRETETLKRKQAMLHATFQRVNAYDKCNPKVTRLNDLIVKLICKEGLPFSLLNSDMNMYMKN